MIDRADVAGDQFMTGPVYPSRLLATWELGGGGGGGFSGTAPAGVVMCLIHEPTLQVTSGVPYPGAIVSSAVVGCDRLVTSNTRVVYTASNSPGFAEFASRFTNGVSELFQTFRGGAADDLVANYGGGGSGQYECWVVQKMKGLPTPANGQQLSCIPSRAQDLAGFVLDSIRLEVANFEFTVTSSTYRHAADQTWRFYGHRASDQ